MKNYINLEGTCWLVQYLNYINKNDKELFYKYLSLNRFIKYNKILYLIKRGKIINNKKYILEEMMSFEGSLFDIQDILNYDIKGKIRKNIKDIKILENNDETLMMFLEMVDNRNVDFTNKILYNLKETFGELEYIKKDKKNIFNIVTYDKKLKEAKYILKNSQFLYENKKEIINIKNNLEEILKNILDSNNNILISIDIGKSLLLNKKISKIDKISVKTLNDFLNTSNHYYIIEEYKVINNELYFKSFTGYKDIPYIFIEFQYIVNFINHIINDNILIDKTKKIDIFKYMEGEY